MIEADQYAIDWRSLFDSLGVAWRDRGSNCHRGNVNIACPFCASDPSFHMGVSEEREAYYCYRDSRHAGRSFVRLLREMGQSASEATRLLNHHRGRRIQSVQVIQVRPQSEAQRLWDRFESAADCRPALTYLESRGFANPRRTIDLYDLRIQFRGNWSKRILIPFRDAQGDIWTWTGRTWDNRLHPKYLMDGEKIAGMVYQPRLARRIVIICEGPIDALKIAVATENEDISAIALSGKSINASKLLMLRQLCGNSLVVFAPDNDVTVGEAYSLKSQLAMALESVHKGIMRLPQGYKDPGEMPLSKIPAWIRDFIGGAETLTPN